MNCIIWNNFTQTLAVPMVMTEERANEMVKDMRNLVKSQGFYRYNGLEVLPNLISYSIIPLNKLETVEISN